MREQGTAAFGTGSLRCVASSWERGMWTALGRRGVVSAWSPLSQARPPHNCGRPAASCGNIRPSAAFLTANLRCVASSFGRGRGEWQAVGRLQILVFMYALLARLPQKNYGHCCVWREQKTATFRTRCEPRHYTLSSVPGSLRLALGDGREGIGPP